MFSALLCFAMGQVVHPAPADKTICPTGIKLEIVADSPLVKHPTGLCFDEHGDLLVLEPTARRIRKLIDRDGDGKYDEARTIRENETATALAYADGYLYLANAQGVERIKQGRGDGPESRERILSGFAARLAPKGLEEFGKHQGVQLAIAGDGWLYVTGQPEKGFVEGADGRRAHAAGTAIFRCRPDGTKLHSYANGFEVHSTAPVLDAAGNVFVADATDKGCRVCFAADGSHSLPALAAFKAGWATSVLLYDDSRLPKHYQTLYCADAFAQRVRGYRLETRGAGFAVAEEFDLVNGVDASFRPCCLVTGPDGAIYIADYRGSLNKQGETAGRIYRLSWSGTDAAEALPLRAKESWEKVQQKNDDELPSVLASDDGSDRRQAVLELIRRGEKNRAALISLFRDAEQPLAGRVAALHVLQTMWNENVQLACADMLRDFNPELRRLSADALGQHIKQGDRDVHELLVQQLSEEDRTALRALYLAIGRINAEPAADAILNALRFDERKDRIFRDGLVRALEMTGKTGATQLLLLADSGDKENLKIAVDVFMSMRTTTAAAALPALLKNYHLSDQQKTDLRDYYRKNRLID